MCQESDFIRRVNKLGQLQIKKMWEELKPPVPGALRKKVEGVWARHALHAAEILNSAIVKNLFWTNGFEYDQETKVAFLVTSTGYPLEQFVARLYHRYDAEESGMGYLALLGGLISEKDIFEYPFTEFHHWILGVDEHEGWITCAIGARVADTTEVDFAVRPGPVLNKKEQVAIAFAGDAPFSERDGKIFPRDPKDHFASHWRCSGCGSIFEKGASSPTECPDCSTAVSPDKVERGFFDAYKIYEGNKAIDQLTYNTLTPLTWWFMRRPKADDIKDLRRPTLFAKKRLRYAMMKQFSENEGAIYTLETRDNGYGSQIVPSQDLLYSASLMRLAFTYSKANNTSLVDTQRTIVEAIGGYSTYSQRKVQQAVQRMNERFGEKN